ncbi:MAG: hypothetical protein WBD22_07490 [Pyrinomonadaceae bacterium]
MNIIAITFVAVSALGLSGCTSQPQNSANSSTANTVAAPAKEAPQAPALSPTDTLKALNAASKEKNIAGIKNLLSRGTLSLIEESAKAQQQTMDELLAEDDGAPFKELPETRNEQVAADSASVEIKNTETGEFEAMPFVKEDGQWKVALDLYLKKMEEALAEDMKQPPANKKADK